MGPEAAARVKADNIGWLRENRIDRVETNAIYGPEADVRFGSKAHMMSALPPKADIAESDWHVRFVPKADILRRSKERRYSVTSSAVASNVCGKSARRFGCAIGLLSAINVRKPWAFVRLPTGVPVTDTHLNGCRDLALPFLPRHKC